MCTVLWMCVYIIMYMYQTYLLFTAQMLWSNVDILSINVITLAISYFICFFVWLTYKLYTNNFIEKSLSLNNVLVPFFNNRPDHHQCNLQKHWIHYDFPFPSVPRWHQFNIEYFQSVEWLHQFMPDFQYTSWRVHQSSQKNHQSCLPLHQFGAKIY